MRGGGGVTTSACENDAKPRKQPRKPADHTPITSNKAHNRHPGTLILSQPHEEESYLSTA